MISVHPSECLRRRKRKRPRKHGTGGQVMGPQIVCGVGARREILCPVVLIDDQATIPIDQITLATTPMMTTIRAILVEEPLIILGLD
jgi:hypothetical protein